MNPDETHPWRIFIRGRYCGESRVLIPPELPATMYIDDLPEALLVAEKKEATAADKAYLADKKVPPGVSPSGWAAAVAAIAEEGSLRELGLMDINALLAAYERAR